MTLNQQYYEVTSYDGASEEYLIRPIDNIEEYLEEYTDVEEDASANFVKSFEELENNGWDGEPKDILILKGEIIVPRIREKVMKYEIE